MPSTRERDHRDLLSGFDMWDAEHVRWKDDAFAYARRECPIVHTSAGTGFWLITRYEDARRILEDWETFSSAEGSPTPTPVRLGPVDSDPPHQTALRALINPVLSRAFSLRFEPEMRRVARELIDGWVDDGQVELMSRFASPFVSRVLARVVFDEDDPAGMERAKQIVLGVVEDGSPEAFVQLAGLSAEYLAKARSNPPDQDGLLRRLVTGTVDGRPVTDEDAFGTLNVVFLGGLDTTRSAIGHIALHMALDPTLEDRVRDPSWVRQDMDEFIRLQSPVATYARNITRDVEVGGIAMKAGERVLIRYDSANRDETRFPDPDRLVFDPPRPSSAAFGLGVHRCLGMHLARVQLAVAFEELLAHITRPRLGCAPDEIVWAPGITTAPARIPLHFDRRSDQPGGNR
jgi:cytochrome P450